MRKYFFLCLIIILAACSSASPATPDASTALVSPLQSMPAGSVLQTPDLGAWSKFGLKGQLIFILYLSHGNQLVRLDLSDGKSTLIFQAPQDAQLNAALLSPDGKQLAVVYAPPPDSAGNFTFSSLFLLPVDGSGALKPVMQGAHPDDAYYNPAWSLDGRALYATHFHRGNGTKANPDGYSLDKITLDGKVSPLIEGAIWPVLSPAGDQLAYLSARIDSPNNELSIAGIDGTSPRQLLPSGAFTTEDNHFFSTDGKTIYFSAVSPAALTVPADPEAIWWMHLLGIQTASAHNLPSDWYRLSLSGGVPKRVTTLQESGLAGTFSPDGTHLALISQSSLYVANPDGSGLQKLLSLTGFGTIQWVGN